METASSRLKLILIQHWPVGLLLLAILWLALAIVFLMQWQQARILNHAMVDGSIVKRQVRPGETREAYAIGYLAAHQGRFNEAARHFTLAEASPDASLRARAKFALGNLYFDIGLKSADIASGEGHIHGLAQIELAREAYKGALRIDPEMRDARYNLELIDRLSPPKRVEGWERETDGVTLVPQKRDGWATMKDNTRRGLP